MIINCTIELKTLAGDVIMDSDNKAFTLGKALGNIIVGSEEQGKMKLYILGTKLFQNKKVEVDEADMNLIKKVVASTKVYGALIAGQCEQLLEEIKSK